MSASSKAKTTRKRYTPEEKKEITDFVAKYDSANGRGGKSAAVKKFGISPISLSSWIGAKASPSATAGKRGRKPGSKNVKQLVGSKGNFSSKIKVLTSLAAEIDNVESKLGQLKAKFNSLKASL
ncbi:MAG: hypothetical protein H7Y36_07015 [Armatimonadetes bacterium]|nr:hypothetical protein [Akkermansiaceae bacterium]